MHRTKVITLGPYRLLPLTDNVQSKHEKLVSGLLDLFSRDEVVRYNPSRRLKSRAAAELKILDTLESYESGFCYDYYLFDLEDDKMIGFVSAISPDGVRAAYPILPSLPSLEKVNSNIWMLEFYLHPDYWRNGIMGIFTGTLMNNLFEQGASLVSALVDANNIASQNTLLKLKFDKNPEYKDHQNQHLYTRDKPIGLQLQ